METLVKEQAIVASVYAEIQQRFVAVADLAHGWEHVQRVYRLALHIARHEGANQFIVGMAALMHDETRNQRQAIKQDHEAPENER